jgi:hypothetical protein
MSISIQLGCVHYLVVVTHFPEEDQELLMELHLFGRVGQVSLHMRIVQQPRKTPQNKIKVFISVNPRQIINEQIVWYCCLQKLFFLMSTLTYILKKKLFF